MDRRPFHFVNGVQVSEYVEQEFIDKLKTIKLYPDDVWIASYMKSGTTWLQQIVRLIRNNGEKSDMKLDFAVPWLEGSSKFLPEFDLDKMPLPRAFHSHFPYSLLPCGPPHTTPCKYIYVVRNPKDVAVSLYFYTRLTIPYFRDMSWEAFWKQYIEEGFEYGNYFDHLQSWLPHTTDQNVLFLKYEEMKKDLQEAVSRIASFIGVALPSDTITKIAQATSFENMKQDDTANKGWREDFKLENGGSLFMRKGHVGDWKNFLTTEQSEEMDSICTQRVKDQCFFVFE